MNLELYTALKGLLRDVELYRNADHVPWELRWSGFVGETVESEGAFWQVVRKAVAEVDSGQLTVDSSASASGLSTGSSSIGSSSTGTGGDDGDGDLLREAIGNFFEPPEQVWYAARLSEFEDGVRVDS